VFLLNSKHKIYCVPSEQQTQNILCSFGTANTKYIVFLLNSKHKIYCVPSEQQTQNILPLSQIELGRQVAMSATDHCTDSAVLDLLHVTPVTSFTGIVPEPVTDRRQA
jgi:hypothetical protein